MSVMQITIRQLQIIEAIIQTYSYSLAAERLHMTQPAISMQMKQLEHNTGVTLFERRGKRIVLSSAGQSLHQTMRKVLTSYDELIEEIHEAKDLYTGRIKVSATTTANHLITQMIANFAKKNKDITVSLKITNREKLVQQLQDFEPDIVLMGEPPAKLDLISEPMLANPLVMIAPYEHEYSNLKCIPLSDIAQREFVVRELGSGTRATIERFFKAKGEVLKSTLEMGSNEAIKHAVSAGLGLGIVSLHSIKLELEAKKLVVLDVEQLPIRRFWHIVRRKGKHLPPAAKQFQDFMIEEAERYADSYKSWLDL
jgi:DNA-binding transcriptional LysR family regulator